MTGMISRRPEGRSIHFGIDEVVLRDVGIDQTSGLVAYPNHSTLKRGNLRRAGDAHSQPLALSGGYSILKVLLPKL